MEPSSSAFADAIVTWPQTMCAKAEIWSAPPNPVCLYTPLEIVAGGVITDDETAVTRRTASLTIADSTGALTPANAQDLLHPLSGNQIRLYRGLVLGGVPEYIACGVYENTQPVATARFNKGVSIDLTLNDMMQPLSTFGWLDPFVVQGDISQIVYTTIDGFLPGLSYELDISNYVVTDIPPLVWGGIGAYQTNQNNQGDGATDPASGVTGIATDAGLEVFFNGHGAVQMRSITVPASRPPQFYYSSGPTSMVMQTPRTFDKSQWFNCAMICGGSATIASPIQAFVFVPPKPNPIIPYSYTSPSIVNYDQAVNCGTGILYRLRWAMESIEMTASPDPRLNSGDVARLNFPESRIAGIYVAENVKMPMMADGKMVVKWRPVQATGIGVTGLPSTGA